MLELQYPVLAPPFPEQEWLFRAAWSQAESHPGWFAPELFGLKSTLQLVPRSSQRQPFLRRPIQANRQSAMQPSEPELRWSNDSPRLA